MKVSKEKLLIKIIAERKRQGLTVAQAAEAAGMVQPDWWRFENGKRVATWDRLITMAEGLGFKVTVNLD
tara:strand:- start:32 stop:238 length:207 start_codon:yes stop_codon:yes gene_type:complete